MGWIARRNAKSRPWCVGSTRATSSPPVGDGILHEDTYPAPDITFATLLGGVELYCDRRFVFGRPSALPEHLREAGEGRRIVLHAMHSGSDWLGFAVWEDGILVRSLSLSPDAGIIENVGEPLRLRATFLGR